VSSRLPRASSDSDLEEIPSDAFAKRQNAYGSSRKDDHKRLSPPQNSNQMDLDLPIRNPANHPLAGSSEKITLSGEPLQRILDLLNALVEKREPHRITEKSASSCIYTQCTLKAYAAAEEILRYHSKQIFAGLDRNKWSRAPFYLWLNSAANQPPPRPTLIRPEDIPNSLRPRKPKHSTDSPDTRVSSKGPSRASTGTDMGFEQNSQDEIGLKFRAGRPSGKAAGLRPAIAGGKRAYRSDEDDEAGPSTKASKTSHSIPDEDDSMDETDQSSLESDEEMVKLVVRSERLVATKPTGPNGTWACDHEDCDHIIRGANNADGQELIRQHYMVHTDKNKKIDLALSESRGHMPIRYVSFAHPLESIIFILQDILLSLLNALMSLKNVFGCTLT
jgi:hypothetical protein